MKVETRLFGSSMVRRMATQSRPNKSDHGVTIPGRFEPRFWDESDGRCALVKEVRRRYEQLKEDTGTDTYQKDLLCQRAIFIAIQLETMEVQAMETGKLDVG